MPRTYLRYIGRNKEFHLINLQKLHEPYLFKKVHDFTCDVDPEDANWLTVHYKGDFKRLPIPEEVKPEPPIWVNYKPAKPSVEPIPITLADILAKEMAKEVFNPPPLVPPNHLMIGGGETPKPVEVKITDPAWSQNHAHSNQKGNHKKHR